MNKQKQVPNVKLQKSSVIFMQLGLILALLIVYIILEHESTYKVKDYAIGQTIIEDEQPYIPTDFVIEEKAIKKTAKSKPIKLKPKPQVQKPASTFEVVKDTDPVIDDLVPPTTEDNQDTPIIDVTDIPEVEDPVDEEPKKPIPFVKIEIAPTFPGCKGTEAEKKACFSKKITKHINRKFDVDLAQTLGLNPGKKRINVEFVINENGDIIDIRTATSSHIRLQKEAKRVISLLPKMIPAKQRLHNVKVKYNLPIIFQIEEE